MADLKTQLTNILTDLKSASIKYQDDPEYLIRTFDIVFAGEKANQVSSEELYAVLSSTNQISANKDDFTATVPDVCKSLKMECHPMRKVDDLTNPTPYAYMIVLW